MAADIEIGAPDSTDAAFDRAVDRHDRTVDRARDFGSDPAQADADLLGLDGEQADPDAGASDTATDATTTSDASVTDPDALDITDEPSLCGDEYTPERDPTQPWLRVGGGLFSFEEVGHCQVVDLVCGPQGGTHVWAGFELGGYEVTDFLEMSFDLVQDDEVVATAFYVDIPDEVEPETLLYTYSGVAVILFGEPTDIDERPATLTLRVRNFDGDGPLDVYDEVTILPECCTI